MATLEFQPLHDTFGAVCHNGDFSTTLSEDLVQQIRAAMATYGVVVFRDTGLDDDSHENLARQLGEPDLSTVAFSRRGKRLAASTQLTDVSNIGDDGKVEPVDTLRSRIFKGNELFHVNCSYNPRRAGFSLLRAHTLPPAGTGGDTQFADTRAAYDDLDADTKQKIQNYVVCHSILHSRRLALSDSNFMQWSNVYDFPCQFHKLVQVHEPSQRTNLYIASHAHHVHGLDEKEGEKAIQKLFDHATQDKYILTLEWKNDGDLVIWDNTCVMHRACGGSFEGKYVRDMRRATVYDGSSESRGVAIRSPWRIPWTFFVFKGVSSSIGLFQYIVSLLKTWRK